MGTVWEDLTEGVCALAPSFPVGLGQGPGRPWWWFLLWRFWGGMGDTFFPVRETRRSVVWKRASF